MGPLEQLSDLVGSVFSVGATLVSAGAIVVLPVAVVRAWRRSKRTEVVIATLDDASGDVTTGSAVLGLTYRLREELLAALPRLAERTNEVVERARKDSTSPIGTVVLDDIARADLVKDITSSREELMDSMENLVPEPARGAYRVLTNALVHPNEVQVSGVLQCVNKDPGGLGLSLTVNPVGAEGAASRITLWEDKDSDVSAKSVVERFHDLVSAAARSLACELLRQRMLASTPKPRRRHRLLGDKAAPAVRREAVIEFLVGEAYLSGARRSAQARKTFYELAERALKKAVGDGRESRDGYLDHFKVSFQRGNALAELARRQGADAEEAINLFSRSTDLFKDAEQKLSRADLSEAERRAERLKVRAALAINACLEAELSPDDVAKAGKAADAVVALTRVDPRKYSADSGALYNLACSLAVAARVEIVARHGVDTDRCLAHAKLCLLHACARKEQWWNDGRVDPDLCLLKEWMPLARRQLVEAGRDPHDGRRPGPRALNARIDAVIKALGPMAVPGPSTAVAGHGRRRQTPRRQVSGAGRGPGGARRGGRS